MRRTYVEKPRLPCKKLSHITKASSCPPAPLKYISINHSTTFYGQLFKNLITVECTLSLQLLCRVGHNSPFRALYFTIELSKACFFTPLLIIIATNGKTKSICNRSFIPFINKESAVLTFSSQLSELLAAASGQS
jgi:hypothetical protein